MIIKRYTRSDREVCISLFLSNAGKYWDQSEVAEFELFLDKEATEIPYFIALIGGDSVGAAGYIIEGGVAWFDWGLVHSDHHGKGIGKALGHL